MLFIAYLKVEFQKVLLEDKKAEKNQFFNPSYFSAEHN